MLKPKHFLILAVVLVILVGISFLQRADRRRDATQPALDVVLAGDWTAAELSRLVVGFGEEAEALVLERGPDGWIVASHWGAAASEQRIDTLLDVLGGLEGEFRSDRADVLADYGLAGQNTVRVTGYDQGGTEAFAIDVGAKVPGAAGQFVRRPGEDTVYLTTTSVLSPLGMHGGPARPGSRHFLHLEAVKEDRHEVDEILLWDDEGRRRLVKEFAVPEPAPGDTSGTVPEPDRMTWEWRLVEPGAGEALAKTKADGVLGSLVTIRAVDVEDPTADPSAYGLAEPARRARLVFDGGRELEFEFGTTREAAPDRPVGVRMRVVGEPTVWVVTEYTANNIFKSTEDLRPES